MSGPLPDGVGDLDTVTFTLPDYSVTVRGIKRYTFTRSFLTPTAAWQFEIAADDAALTPQLREGARIQLAINGQIQCTGTVGRRTSHGTKGGSTFLYEGRDILGRCVDATVDPAFQFAAGMTVPQVVLGVLAPFGITKVYNADIFNTQVITGYPAGVAVTTTQVSVQEPDLTTDAAGVTTLNFKTVANRVVAQAQTRPDLTTLQIQQAKPHAGEGVLRYLDRLLSRLGYALWAAADGSGVVIDTADFDMAPNYQIRRLRSDLGVKNNVLSGGAVFDVDSQPACVVAFGFGGGPNMQKTKLKVIMVNELVGLNADGSPIDAVAAIIARYKGALVLPIRSSVKPLSLAYGTPPAAPYFTKDDEAKNLQQLAAFTRREMAKWQSKGLAAQYEVAGHTQNTHPWSVNTTVDVQDEVSGVSETMWVESITMTKGRDGTRTTVKPIRLHTLQIGA